MYRWRTPYEWLSEAVSTRRVDEQDLMYLISRACGSDDIQDAFEEEMGRDGYFEEVE